MTTLALKRRANSLPSSTLDLLVRSHSDEELLRPPNEGRLATSPSFVEPRSPSGIATFSPVFDLELGGTPQEQRHDRLQPMRRVAAAPGQFRELLPEQPPVAPRQLIHAARAATGAVSGAALDRSQSDLQVMLAQQGGKAVVQHAIEALNPAVERLFEMSKPGNEMEMELSRLLRAFRSARITKPYSSASTPASDSGPSSGGGSNAAAGLGTVQTSGVSPSGPTPGEIEALASELQSAGFIVQVLDGAGLSKDARSCLRTLKHRFLVCLGLGGTPQRRPQLGQERRAEHLPHQRLFPRQQQPQQQQPFSQHLTEPLVVEVRFREQFLIANPSRAYEHLLLALPVSFVGPLRRLDAVVELMAAEVAVVFKEAGRPLPPWRTKSAMLSKWAPSQLMDLARMMWQVATVQQMQQQQQQQTANGIQQQGVEPASNCHTSWDLGIGELPSRMESVAADPFQAASVDPLQPATTDTCGLKRNELQLCAAASTGGATADAPAAGLCAMHAWGLMADATTRDGADAAKRFRSAHHVPLGTLQPMTGAGSPSSETPPFLAHDNITNKLMYESQSRTSNLELPDTSVLIAGSPRQGQGVAVTAAATTVSAAAQSQLGALTFPVLPELDLPMTGLPQRLLSPFVLEQVPLPLLPPEEHIVHLQPQSQHQSQRTLQPLKQQDQEQAQERKQDLLDGLRVPSLQPPPRSAFSPFACVSMPNVLDPDEAGGALYTEEDVSSPKVPSDNMPRVFAGAVAGSLVGMNSDLMPEFTLRHAALAATPAQLTAGPGQHFQQQHLYSACGTLAGEYDMSKEQDDALVGAMHGGPTLPMPTPPRTAGPLQVSAFHIGLSHTMTAVDASGGCSDIGLALAHQPLASGAMGLSSGPEPGPSSGLALPPNASAAVPTSGLTTMQTHPGGSSGGNSTSTSTGGGFALPFSKADSFRITRRSSSDLSRAANKIKNTKSLLAAALRRAIGTGPGRDGSGATGSPSPSTGGGVTSTPLGYAPLGGPQEEQRDGLVRDNCDCSGGGAEGCGRPSAAIAAPGAGTGARPAAVAAAVQGHGHEVTQVALEGGVMTRRSGGEPPWARIATVRWAPPPAAGAGAAPPAGAAAGAAGRGL